MRGSPILDAAAIILGQCAFVLLVIAGWRRSSWRGLLAWTLPLVAVVVGELLVGIGRYAAVRHDPGSRLQLRVRSGCPAALGGGAGVSSVVDRRVWPAPVTESTAAGAGTPKPPPSLVPRVWRCVVASSVVSAVSWTNRWHESPAKTYVGTLLASVRQTGPSANLYDTPGFATRAAVHQPRPQPVRPAGADRRTCRLRRGCSRASARGRQRASGSGDACAGRAAGGRAELVLSRP